ncbi:MAG TPA: MlaD family protein [Pirellulales bacterium]|jgi:phospholipid/cholesterol/gamma-HCH transport system substrate-binding protein|nr:MlaD family protein [Pirellulales bacterium]
MDDKVVKFRVGVVVLATMIILVILILLFNDVGSLWIGRYTLYIHFPEAPGVASETPVRKDGILIGSVTRVRFADDDPRFNTTGGVIVTVAINADRRIHKNERCRISSTLIGDALLEFVPGGTHPSKELLKNDDYLQGTVASNPLQLLQNLEGNIGEAISSVAGAGNEIGRLATRVNVMLDNNGDQLGRIINKTERAIDSFERTMNGINVVLGVNQNQTQTDQDGNPLPDGIPAELNKDLVTLPRLMAETRDAVVEMRAAIQTANKNLANLERFTAPLGDNGAALITKVDSSVGHLDELLQQFVMFGQALNRQEGTVGLLLHNPDLYQHLNAAACNIEQITRELKPIIRDARAFADKIARHPESLGVRGAIKPNTGIK